MSDRLSPYEEHVLRYAFAKKPPHEKEGECALCDEWRKFPAQLKETVYKDNVLLKMVHKQTKK